MTHDAMTDQPVHVTAPAATVGGPRQSPLDAVHTAAGAAFTYFGGWRMPLRFSGGLAEHAAVRSAAGLFDLSHMGEVVVIGPQADAALDAALLSDLSAIEQGRAKYTLLLSEDGGVLDDLVVYRTGIDRFLVVANAANTRLVVEELRARTTGFDCEVRDETADVGLLALQGPRAAEVLLGLEGFSADEDDLDGARFADAVRALRNYRFIAAHYDGQPVLVARTGYTGELGFEIFSAAALLPELWSLLLDRGRAAGVVPVGLGARDTLRLEAGMPLHGQELTALTRPAQAGLGRLVDPAKRADHVGRAALAAADEPDRVLVGLVSAGRRAGRPGYPVRDGAGRVGTVTSGALSPTLGHPIAMAYVDRASSAVGTALTIEVRGSDLAASVVALPFYSRKAKS